jgi:hypothetical protein
MAGMTSEGPSKDDVMSVLDELKLAEAIGLS